MTYQQQRKAANRERILQATLELAQEEGWSNITMRRIADRIQYTHPALYGYFATKQDLLTALLQQGLQMLSQHIARAYATEHDPETALRAIAEAYWKFAWEHPELYQVMHGLGGVAFTNIELRAQERQVGDPIAVLIRQLLEQHGREQRDIDRKVMLLWSTLHGIITLTMAGRFDRSESDALVEQMIQDSFVAWGIYERRL